MAYGTGKYHKIVNPNRKVLENTVTNTTDPSSVASTASYSYKKLNRNTDITSLKI